MRVETAPYDPAEFLANDELIAGYLTDALDTSDPRVIANALGAVVRARGGVELLAKDTGIAGDDLRRALNDGGNPEFAIVLKVMHALGVRLSATLVA